MLILSSLTILRIALHDAKNARLLARAIENTEWYDVISDSHRLIEQTGVAGAVEKAKQATGLTDNIEAYVPGLPVVSFKFTDKIKAKYPHLKGTPN
jgi:glutamate decarboxylase